MFGSQIPDTEDIGEVDEKDGDYQFLRRKYLDLKQKYKELELKYDELYRSTRNVHPHSRGTTNLVNSMIKRDERNIDYQGVCLVFDDNRGLYGKYHENLTDALYKSPGKLSPFRRDIIDEYKAGNRNFELLLYVTVSSGGRKINLMGKQKFHEFYRRSKNTMIIDCRPKKRYENCTKTVGGEDFPSDVQIVYIMMPEGDFDKGEGKFNEESMNRIVKIIENFVERKSRGFFSSFFGGN